MKCEDVRLRASSCGTKAHNRIAGRYIGWYTEDNTLPSMVKEVPDITDTPESEGQEGTAIDDDGVAGVALVEPTFGKVGVMPSHMELPPP